MNSLSSLLKRLRTAVSSNGPDLARPAGSTSTDPATAQRELLNGFEKRVKAGANVVAGKVTVVSLDTIRGELSADWDRISARVDAITREAIAAHIGPGDIFAPLDGYGHVIIFAEETAGQADEITNLVRLQVEDRLRREVDEGRLAVEAGLMDFNEVMFGETATPEVAAAVSSAATSLLDATSAQPRCDWDQQPDPRDAPLEFAFWPSWQPARNIVSSYLCVIDKRPGLARRGRYPDADLESRHPDVVMHRDLAAFDHAIKELKWVIAERRRLLIHVSLSFETVSRPVGWREVRDRLSELSEQKKRLLVVDLSGIPEMITPNRLADIVLPIGRGCRAVSMCLPFGTRLIPAARQCGAIAVGVDLNAHGGSEAEIMPQLRTFRKEASAAKIISYARGVNTASLALSATANGFDFIEGKSVMTPIERPRRIIGFEAIDLYRLALSR